MGNDSWQSGFVAASGVDDTGALTKHGSNNDRNTTVIVSTTGGSRMDSSVISTIKHRETIRAVFKSELAPELTAQHCALIRLLRVTWMPIESGGPGIEISQPFGEHNPTLATVMAALKVNDEAVAARLVAELGLLIAPYVRSAAQLAPGLYPLPADVAANFSSPECGVGPDGHFNFTAEHATVLKLAYWTNVDATIIDYVLQEDTEMWPMPYVDGKYPYGESGYYQIDMANALGEPYALDDGGHMIHDEAKDDRLEKLHFETLAALQVFLTHATPLAR
ncbi:MAG: hypothetical protein WKG03_08780 [Telluria sp.]